MSQDSTLTKRKGSRLKLIALGVATAGLFGGAATQLTIGITAAHADQNKTQNNSISWHSHDNNVSMDSSLVIDAVESFYARKQMTPTPGTTTPPAPTVDVDTMQVTRLIIQGDNAAGAIDNGDNVAHFFAHKTDGVWQIVFAGNDTPSGTVMQQYGIPKAWTDPNFKF